MVSALMADKAPGFMDLRDVVERGQFEAFYHSNGLHSIEDRISHLKKSMKIRATYCDEEETPKEVLDGLEETALLGYWKAYS
jgi:hypothetical protein